MSASPKPPIDPLPWVYWGLFLVVAPIVALWMANKPASQVNLPVPARDLPPYHVIVASDVVTKAMDTKYLLTDTVRDQSNLIGHYTRDTLHVDQSISKNQVVAVPDSKLISGTFAVAIPASNATILGGNLQAGDVVTLASVPISDTASIPTKIFDAVLILDVKVVEEDIVVVLAIPVDRWIEYLTRIQNARIVLARKVE